MGTEGRRDARSQSVHDRAVRLIADERFAVSDWNVVINPAQEQNDYLDRTGTQVVPDIVARHDEDIVALGEVETAESISDQEARQWLQLGQLCSRLYLFVPQGSEQTAADLIQRYGICCAGLRSYSLDNNKLCIESIAIPNGYHKWDDHPWWASIGRTEN